MIVSELWLASGAYGPVPYSSGPGGDPVAPRPCVRQPVRVIPTAPSTFLMCRACWHCPCSDRRIGSAVSRPRDREASAARCNVPARRVVMEEQ